jgi:DNA-directed RNA polymerase subunit RPC12/RpoP
MQIQKEQIIVGGLAVLIVGLLAYNVYSFFAGPSAIAGTGGKDMFKCTECQHDFEFTEEMRNELMQNLDERGGGGIMDMTGDFRAIDCPSCNAENSSIRMTRCPKCGHYWLSEQDKAFAENPEPSDEELMRIDEMTEVCPECGTDRVQYLREQYENR